MIKELLNKGLKYSLANPSEFAKAYKEAFGETVCSYCPDKIQAKFMELLKITEDKLKTMKQRKWKMIPGKLIDTSMSAEGPQGQYTDKNLTDDIAEQLIAKGYGKYFVKNENATEDIEEPAGNIPDDLTTETEISFTVLEKNEPLTEAPILDGEVVPGLVTPEKPEEKTTTEDPAEVKKDSFGTYSFSKLVQYCKTNGFPASEWENKNRKDLIPYVRSKV